MSRFLPASSRTTFRPPSVSSLTAHEPDAPEPTTIASYVDPILRIRAYLVSCVRISFAIGGGHCHNRGSRSHKDTRISIYSGLVWKLLLERPVAAELLVYQIRPKNLREMTEARSQRTGSKRLQTAAASWFGSIVWVEPSERRIPEAKIAL
jgi:hypothetical protein